MSTSTYHEENTLPEGRDTLTEDQETESVINM